MKSRWRLLLGAAIILVLGGVLAFDHGADARQASALKPAARLGLKEPASVPALPATATPAAAKDGNQTIAATENSDTAKSLRMAAEATADLFATKSWYVAPPPPPPPKPVAPPFPYVLTGSQRDGEIITALFVVLGERNFIVSKGGMLGGQYRLDEITDTEAVFTYLPLKEQQILPIGNNP
jgi:hypothetical protein